MGFDLPHNIPPLEYFMELIDRDHMKIEFERQNRDIGEHEEIL